MAATDKPIPFPSPDADRDTLVAFCKECKIAHHWKHGKEKLWAKILAWKAASKPKRPGVLGQHRGNLDFIKRSEDPGLVDGRKEMLKALMAANRTQTTMAYHLRVYIEALEKKAGQPKQE